MIFYCTVEKDRDIQKLVEYEVEQKRVKDIVLQRGTDIYISVLNMK